MMMKPKIHIASCSFGKTLQEVEEQMDKLEEKEKLQLKLF